MARRCARGSGDRTGARPVEPLIAARAVLVARASAQAGAIMTGAWVGLLVLRRPAQRGHRRRRGDTAAAALGAGRRVGAGRRRRCGCSTAAAPRTTRPTAPGRTTARHRTRAIAAAPAHLRRPRLGSRPWRSRPLTCPPPAASGATVLGTVVGLVVFGVCGLVVLGLVSGSIGVGAVLVGALCALVPVGPVVWAFLWVDRWEPEPPRTLLFAFLWGACVAALSALLINSSAVLVADAVLGQGSGDVLGASVIAPIVEEGVKGAFVVGLLIFRRREFDGIVDGIVYAGLVGAGFAFTENILYMGRAFAEDGRADRAGRRRARGAHPARGPLAVRAPAVHVDDRHRLRARRGQPLGGGPGAVRAGRILRWRWCCTRCGTARRRWAAARRSWGSTSSSWCRCSSPWSVLVAWQRRREQRTVARPAARRSRMAGWIAPSEVALLSTLAGRNRWRRAVRQRSGKDAAKAVSEYQTAVTELAFLRARMGRGAVGPQAWEWHNERLVRPGRRAGAGDGAAGGADRGLAASAALGLGAAAPATARLAPEPVAAARLERRAARWRVEPTTRRGRLGPATRLNPTRPRWRDGEPG